MSSTVNSISTAGTSGITVKGVTGYMTGSAGIYIIGIISIGLFIASIVQMSNFVGSKDDWNQIKSQITKVLILTLIGTFGFTIATLLYIIQDSAKAVYITLIMACIALGLSYSALAIAIISR
jgi:hypothetical protein